jgi:uncharacterized protein YbbC (DUF1343 family)
MHVLFFVLMILSVCCTNLIAATTSTSANTKVLLGIDVLQSQDFAPLKGKRVGLLTNQAGVNSEGKSTIDVFYKAPNVRLVALFGPEHGIDGKEKAEQPIDNQIHPKTGLPVYSLYGKYRKPTSQMLQKIDVLVVDLQDIGVRSYTYVSCMRLAMEACFENQVEVIVLDRPNPLGGLKVDGPIMEDRFISYVGAVPVPYVHGLTIGEIATMAKNEPHWLKTSDSVRKHGKLTVIPMKGWKRSMLWSETGLKWIATSPAIPDFPAVMGYAMTGLGCQIGGFRHGYGSPYPFRALSFQGRSSADIMHDLKSKHIPGVDFKTITFRDNRGNEQQGAYVIIRDFATWRPTELSFYLMDLACTYNKSNVFKAAPKAQSELFNKHVGSLEWWSELCDRGSKARVNHFVTRWQKQANDFQKKSATYYLYR